MSFRNNGSNIGFIWAGQWRKVFRCEYGWEKGYFVLLQYCNDGDSWNMPVIFLQENPDNMMYLDYPNLESYKVEAKTENGTPFYRDTF